tara:strand:+ start:4021 stop:4251 length:231 start_codon:yes stop_codon:yes gene_type:complete
MQKIINGVALFSGVVSLGIVVGGSLLYFNKDNIVEGAKAQIAASITASIQNALPGIVDASVPVIPETTGPAIPTFR